MNTRCRRRARRGGGGRWGAKAPFVNRLDELGFADVFSHQEYIVKGNACQYFLAWPYAWQVQCRSVRLSVATPPRPRRRPRDVRTRDANTRIRIARDVSTNACSMYIYTRDK